jgi:hypothetical protein
MRPAHQAAASAGISSLRDLAPACMQHVVPDGNLGLHSCQIGWDRCVGLRAGIESDFSSAFDGVFVASHMRKISCKHPYILDFSGADIAFPSNNVAMQH